MESEETFGPYEHAGQPPPPPHRNPLFVLSLLLASLTLSRASHDFTSVHNIMSGVHHQNETEPHVSRVSTVSGLRNLNEVPSTTVIRWTAYGITAIDEIHAKAPFPL